MKKHNQEVYIKALECRLSAAEVENRHLKLKTEAFETAIRIAEEQLQIRILKSLAGPPVRPNRRPTNSSAPAARAIPWWA